MVKSVLRLPACPVPTPAACSCHQLAWHDQRWVVVQAAPRHLCDQCQPKAALVEMANQLNFEHGRWGNPRDKKA